MAENLGSKHEDIGEVKILVTLENINNFEKFQTKEFFVRGNSWYISFEKKKKSDIDHLGISLCSKAKHESDDSFVMGSFKLKTVPSKPGSEVLKKMLSAQVFTANRMSSTLDIPWDQLMNPEDGYVENDKCKIQIKTKATPLQNATSTDWVAFQTVGLRKTYQMTVKKFDEFIGASTPEFIVNGIFFRVSVVQYEGHLFMKIHDIKGTKCTLCLTFRLISFDPKIMPLVEEYKDYKLCKFSGRFVYFGPAFVCSIPF